MAKNKTRTSNYESDYEDRVMKVLHTLTHRDLQRECVLRGLPFTDVVSMSHHTMVGWFYKNFDNTQNPTVLTEYDVWLETELEQRGHKKGEAMLSPSLRLGYTSGIEAIERVSAPKAQSTVPKEKKERAKVDESTGVRAGTKKALTYQLALEGEDIDTIIKKVKESFPDAEPKSIKIWAKRAIKENKGE